MANIPFLNNAYFSAKVGIGTDSPNKPLTIQTNDSSWGSMRIYRDSATLGETAIGFFGTSTQATNQAWVIGEGGWGNVGDFIIGNENGGAGGNVRMLIQRDGNVGIGTTSPSRKLTIGGISNTGDGLKIEDPTNTAYGAHLTYYDAGSEVWLGGITNNVYNQTLSIHRDATRTITVDINNNVGIGTASPVSVLEVYGGSSGVNDVDRYVRFKASNGEKRFDFYVGGTGNASIFNMYTSDGTTKNVQIASGGTSYFNGGNVGIGTTSPDYLLDLYKSTATTTSNDGTTLQRLWNYVGSDLQQQKTFIDFVFTDDNANEYPQVRIGAEVGQNGNAGTQILEGSGAFVVYTNNATGVGPGTPTGLAERFRVDYQGNVGIGTTSPDAKLDIGVNNIITLDDTGSSTGFIGLGSYNDGTKNRAQGASYYGFGIEVDRPNARMSMNSYDSNGIISNSNITLKNNGNVGIGTTSPDSKLHTYNSLYNYKDVVIESDVPSIRFADIASTENSFGMNIDGGKLHFSTYTYANRFASDSGARLITLTTEGNVGIGTLSPVSHSQARKTLVVADTVNGANVEIWGNSAGGKSILQSVGGNTYMGNLANGTGSGTTYITSGAGNTYTTILANGNVGIGTTSPSNKLSLAGSGQNWVTSPAIKMWDSYNSKGWYVGSANNSTPGDFYIRSVTTEGAYPVAANKQFTIKQSGNVGIGTISPSSKLQVDGGIQMADDTATASAAKVGTLKYRVSGNNSYVDMCMQTGATTYAWINIVQNNW